MFPGRAGIVSRTVLDPSRTFSPSPPVGFSSNWTVDARQFCFGNPLHVGRSGSRQHSFPAGGGLPNRRLGPRRASSAAEERGLQARRSSSALTNRSGSTVVRPLTDRERLEPRGGVRRKHEREARRPGQRLELEPAAHQRRELARDREAEAAAGGDRAVEPVEAVEDVRLRRRARSPARRRRPTSSRRPARPSCAESRTVVPGGVCTIAFSTRMRPICSTRSSSPSAGTAPADVDLERVAARGDARPELDREQLAERREIEALGRDRQPARVHPREVEQVGRELGQARHLARGSRP